MSEEKLGICPLCGVRLRQDDWNDPDIDGFVLWEHPTGHECQWCGTTLSRDNWHQLAALALDARLGRMVRRMSPYAALSRIPDEALERKNGEWSVYAESCGESDMLYGDTPEEALRKAGVK